MIIGILETGRPPEELDGAFGDYPGMFADLLSGEGRSFKSWAVLDGALPSSPQEADGWLITGSRFGVYEDHPWIGPLKDFICDVHDAGLPLVGICFGHQIMAEALGGRAEKFSGGWAIGGHEYALGDGTTVALNAFHQDQVTELPEGAEVIAGSDFCKYAALRYRGNTVSLQPHPEFAADYLSTLLTLRKDLFPPDVFAKAEAVADSAASTPWAIALILSALEAGKA